MLKIQARPLKTMHDEQYRSDQPVLLVVPFELGLCLVHGAADFPLSMMLHDVPTGNLQVVGILNHRRNADNCVPGTLFAVLFCMFGHICMQSIFVLASAF